ncbi:folate-binding protein YgfZ [soil metagenome]
MNKPNDPDAAFFALPEQKILALEGRDAVAFAQAQFMSDVAGLADGQWQWSGWLTPKGRLIALFAVLRREAQTLWLLLPDADAGEMAARLQGFVFRSKIALTVRDDFAVSGSFAPAASARGAQAGIADGQMELDFSGDAGPRTLRISPAPAPVDPSQAALWARFDLAHGLPRLPSSQAGQWTPQQLSLERLRAYSVKKGCYPGQEIVARTHYLGQAKRGLVRLRGDGVTGLGPVQLAGTAVGQLVSAVGDESLAVMGPEPRQGLMAGGAPCVVLPLDAGLAR